MEPDEEKRYADRMKWSVVSWGDSCYGRTLSWPLPRLALTPLSLCASCVFAGIDLENIVYYKDNTHYFVMTAKKQSLLEKGVIRNVSCTLSFLSLTHPIHKQDSTDNGPHHCLTCSQCKLFWQAVLRVYHVSLHTHVWRGCVCVCVSQCECRGIALRALSTSDGTPHGGMWMKWVSNC